MLKTLLERKQADTGLSSRKLAEEIGTSHTTILRASRGEPVDVGTLIKIGDYLGVRPSALIDSLASSQDGDMDAQLGVLLDSIPGLRSVVEDATKSVAEGKASPEIIQDILKYAQWKLSEVQK